MPKFVPLLVPQGDDETNRRHIVQKLNDLGRNLAKSSQRTEAMDLGGHRVSSVADPGAPTDAVNLRTLKKHIDSLTHEQVRRSPPSAAAATGSIYSIVFSSIGMLVSGQLSAPYIIMPSREGMPVAVKLAATSTGTADCHMQVARNGTAILASDLVLPAGQHGPVTTTVFVPSPGFHLNDQITPVVLTAGGVGYVTIEVEVQVT